MLKHTRKVDDTKAKILTLCKKDYRTAAQLAAALGKSVNTVRAYYVYPMVRDGQLKPLYPVRRPDQAYTCA